MEYIKQYLNTDTSKLTFDLEKLTIQQRKGHLKMPRFFSKHFFIKIEYLDAYFYKAARLFDPRQLLCISNDIDSF